MSISLTDSEEKELRGTLNQLEGYFGGFFIFTGGIVTAILVMAGLKVELPSATISALYYVFLVSVVFCVIAAILVLWVLFIKYQVVKGKGIVVMVKRPTRCINVTKSKLCGKSYCVYKLFGFRYAFRIGKL